MEINDIIRKLRTEQGLTMKQLGAKVGVTEQAISQYERGKRVPSDELLIEIFRVLNFDIDPYIKKTLVAHPIWEKTLEYLTALIEYSAESGNINPSEFKYMTLKEIDLFIKDSISALEVFQKKHIDEDKPSSGIVITLQEKDELIIDVNND